MVRSPKPPPLTTKAALTRFTLAAIVLVWPSRLRHACAPLNPDPLKGSARNPGDSVCLSLATTSIWHRRQAKRSIGSRQQAQRSDSRGRTRPSISWFSAHNFYCCWTGTAIHKHPLDRNGGMQWTPRGYGRCALLCRFPNAAGRVRHVARGLTTQSAGHESRSAWAQGDYGCPGTTLAPDPNAHGWHCHRHLPGVVCRSGGLDNV